MPRKSPFCVNLSSEERQTLESMARRYTSSYCDVISASAQAPETNDPFKGFPFPKGTTPLQCHLYAGAKNICSGAFAHRKAAIQLIWEGAGIVWHPWIDRALSSFCDYNWITWTGPAASAKSFNASLIGLLYWLEYPEGTSVIMASTTRDALSRRLWYYIQDLHSRIAKRPDLTIGQALYSEYMIRLRAGDKKNGIFGLAIEDGPVEEALHNLIGYHNTRVLLVVDEAQGTREAIFQACDNLSKNPEFKALLLGNAESREDPHGRFSEPLDGWLSVDPDTSEQWETRGGPARGLGCCVFFDGRKSPAITEADGSHKYPFLINRRQIHDALAYHGSSEHPRFWSQSIGFWPPVGITQTVLDERIVLNNHLREPATWYTDYQQCAVLDPSYEGGDRKVFLPFKIGQVPAEDGARTWRIEFGTAIELKISVRLDQEIHYQIFHQCVEVCRQLNIPPNRFALGSSGEGGGLLSIFRREWGPVIGIEEAGKVSDRPVSAVNPRPASEEYDRVVTELCFAVREFACNDALRMMPPEAIKEFCARRWEMRSKKIRVETKSEMRKHYPRSPDYADSVSFAVELARRLGAVAGTELKNQPQNDWMEWQREYDDMIADENSFMYPSSLD